MPRDPLGGWASFKSPGGLLMHGVLRSLGFDPSCLINSKLSSASPVYPMHTVHGENIIHIRLNEKFGTSPWPADGSHAVITIMICSTRYTRIGCRHMMSHPQAACLFACPCEPVGIESNDDTRGLGYTTPDTSEMHSREGFSFGRRSED